MAAGEREVPKDAASAREPITRARGRIGPAREVKCHRINGWSSQVLNPKASANSEQRARAPKEAERGEAGAG